MRGDAVECGPDLIDMIGLQKPVQKQDSRDEQDYGNGRNSQSAEILGCRKIHGLFPVAGLSPAQHCGIGAPFQELFQCKNNSADPVDVAIGDQVFEHAGDPARDVAPPHNT